MELDKLNKSLFSSVTSENLTSLSSDGAEVILDSLLNDGIIKDIPVFGTIYNIAKIGIGIRERFFAKKVYNLLLEIADVPIDKREKFIKDLEDSDELKQRVGESLIVLIDKLDHIEKPKIIGQLLKARMYGKIELNKFLRLCTIIEKSFLYDLYELEKYVGKSIYQEDISESLEKLGLVYNSVINGNAWIGDDSPIESKYSITNLGMQLLSHGLTKNQA